MEVEKFLSKKNDHVKADWLWPGTLHDLPKFGIERA
jgi:hypothetical protein